MTLGERIRQQRQRAGLSQEKVAELVGVSRQAVTKWETGQSAPSTDNLFKLAEIFDSSVDLLLAESAQEELTVEARALAMFEAMQKEKEAQAHLRRRKNIRWALAVLAGYLLLWLIGLLLWSDGRETTVLGWLSMANPKGEHDYLFGWLLHKRLLWYAMVLSVVTALWGKRRFAVTSLAGFFLGLLAGVLFGPYPPGEIYGHDHYGWAIWAVCFLVAMIVGGIVQRKSPT